MELEEIKKSVTKNKKIKSLVYTLMINKVRTRPRWWLRLFRFLYCRTGAGSIIYRSVRKDLVPFNPFFLGKNSVVEDYSVLNNFVGAIAIGDNTRVGLHNVVIGPVSIGNNVNIAQGVVLSGLDHNYKDVNLRIDQQGVSTSQIVIEDDVWIGANAVVTKGVRIGRHSIIAACSLVNREIPPYCVAAGNPAVIIRKYNPEKDTWERTEN
jgi:acetyltransferase-like isoleucine patch superfamily enzyme